MMTETSLNWLMLTEQRFEPVLVLAVVTAIILRSHAQRDSDLNR